MELRASARSARQGPALSHLPRLTVVRSSPTGLVNLCQPLQDLGKGGHGQWLQRSRNPAAPPPSGKSSSRLRLRLPRERSGVPEAAHRCWPTQGEAGGQSHQDSRARGCLAACQGWKRLTFPHAEISLYSSWCPQVLCHKPSCPLQTCQLPFAPCPSSHTSLTCPLHTLSSFWPQGF